VPMQDAPSPRSTKKTTAKTLDMFFLFAGAPGYWEFGVGRAGMGRGFMLLCYALPPSLPALPHSMGSCLALLKCERLNLIPVRCAGAGVSPCLQPVTSYTEEERGKSLLGLLTQAADG